MIIHFTTGAFMKSFEPIALACQRTSAKGRSLDILQTSKTLRMFAPDRRPFFPRPARVTGYPGHRIPAGVLT